MSTEDNIIQQSDEIEAVSAIYGDDFCVVDEYLRCYSIKVTVDSLVITLLVTLPPDYPSSAPPKYEIDAHWLRGSRRQQLQAYLEDVYLENVGESVLYLWAERTREFLQELNEIENTTNTLAELVVDEAPHSPDSSSENQPTIECPVITSGELIIDRKSVFQPHLARVNSVQQVPVVLNTLKENKKIATATHNIYAYRIQLPNGLMAQDCEDDGETKAGSRMLHLMAMMNVENVLVIVTRWYGGCHIGPDRFKHINTATRNILEKCGFLDHPQDNQQLTSGTDQKKKTRKPK